jgi:hypothetical protein
MDDSTLTTAALAPPPGATPRVAAPGTGRRRPPRPARPRAATTVSTAILTDRGLAEGYVALPLARLMAHRVWASVETLNQQLVLLEQYSFTRMTSDSTFEAQGAAFTQLLRAYATLTAAVATLAQRLAQNRLTEGDRLVLATGDLTLLLPAAPQTRPASLPDPALAPPPAAPEAAQDPGPAPGSAPATPERSTDLPALTAVANGATGEVP